MPFLKTNKSALPHNALYWRLGEHMAIRKGNWKLVMSPDGALNPHPAPWTNDELAGAQLFDLSKDLSERNNLAAAQPAKVKELAADWLAWNSRLMVPRWAPNIRD
jgi:arylsulfatase A-like enzyme